MIYNKKIVKRWGAGMALAAWIGGLAFAPTSAHACVGARGLGMGGAFVAVADDASTTYWNPAGLAFMPQRQITGMYIPGDDINYKIFGSYSQPLGDRYAFGVSVFTWNPRPVGYTRAGLIELEYMRPWVSFAARIPQVTTGELAVGLNLDFGQAQLTLAGDEQDLDVDVGLDLSALYRFNEKWSIGILIQDINEPAVKWPDGSTWMSWKRNVRPGVAFRPNEKTTLALDIYDLTDGRYFNIGAEYWLSEKVGIRGGMYLLDGTDWPTVGGSYRVNNNFSIEAAALDFEHFVFSATYAFNPPKVMDAVTPE